MNTEFLKTIDLTDDRKPQSLKSSYLSGAKPPKDFHILISGGASCLLKLIPKRLWRQEYLSISTTKLLLHP